MSTIEIPPILRPVASAFSQRLVAAAIILLFVYYAAGVVITLLLSMLLAYFLDPAVEFLERFRIPRAVGSLIMVLILISCIAASGYVLYDRMDEFAANWPKYKGTLREATGTIQGKISGIEGSVSDLTTSDSAPRAASPSQDGNMVHNLLLRGIGSLYALVLEGTFVPFLVFFMLAQKREVWHATLQLFP